ncbi:MAG: diguanylate cyclase [Mariprofundaceae bacterium]|nr:diguanylate cyclase [Mariprofundaceae bacterium]
MHFTLTPYMHFPGAFTSFDEATGVLFSSDIFGGFTEKWSLYAEDETHFDNIQAFHEHYMPSRDIVHHLIPVIAEVFTLDTLEFYAGFHGEKLLYLGPANRYRGEEVDEPDFFRDVAAGSAVSRSTKHCRKSDDGKRLFVPLNADKHAMQAMAVLKLAEDMDISPEMDEAIGQLCDPLMIAIEREVIYRSVEKERDELYLRSIHDPLTGLYSRYYMHDAVERMLASHDRGVISGMALIMLDVDHFKRINDTYGHSTGDTVLEALGAAILDTCRTVDIPVRIGGEEFATFIVARNPEEGKLFAERLCKFFMQQSFCCEDKEFHVTMSAGVANHMCKEDLASLIQRADKALYEAKEGGRNRVCSGTP